MRSKDGHLSEQEFVLAANGELPSLRKTKLAAHLDKCWQCRERMRGVEDTVVSLVRARQRDLDAQLPAAEGPRALLRAKLAEASRSQAGRARWPLAFSTGRLAVAGGAFVAVFLGILVIFQSTVNAGGPKPRLAITPGETRPISLAEVCLYPKAQVIAADIPLDVQATVFATYGIKSPQAGQFEVDYLITPDLGGTSSIRNLWPQPYSARWNAHVKDKLEERLHTLVCSGKLDLSTAQRDIATDWIAAYKKYM